MRSVAIIDDHTLFSSGLELLLQELDQPLDTRLFVKPEDFFSATNFTPCLIILDFYLPGFSFSETINQIKATLSCPVLVVSASQSPADKSEALASGASVFLQKHVEPTILRDTVIALLDGEVPMVKTDSTFNFDDFALTERQLEVLMLVAKGYTNKEIASSFKISPETVKSHLKSIFARISVQNRVEAIEFIREQGIV